MFDMPIPPPERLPASPGTGPEGPFRRGAENLSTGLIRPRHLRAADPMRDDVPEPPAAEPAPATPPAEAEPAEDWETRFKYLLADFENFRRRSERDREAAGRQTRGALLRELLPILEAFRAARSSWEALPARDPVRTGLEILDREWATFLKHEGVESVAKVGDPFRASEQEAVGEMPTREGVAEGAVAEIVQQGYRFYGGLLRPAKVFVARVPSPVGGDSPPEDRPPAPGEGP